MISEKKDLLYELTEQVKKAKTEIDYLRIEVNKRLDDAVHSANEIVKSDNEELAQLVRDMRTWMKSTAIRGSEYDSIMERAEELVDNFFETKAYKDAKEAAA